MLDRRDFLTYASGAAAALMAPPGLSAEAIEAGKDVPPLPARDLYLRDEEAYWTEIRR